MDMDLIIFRSITPAQRGRRLLEQARIPADLQRTPRSVEQQGCGYCLRLRRTDTPRAVALLKREGVDFLRVVAAPRGTRP